MKTAYAVKVTENNVEGIKYYGYLKNIPDNTAKECYLALANGGPYAIETAYFEEQFEFTDSETTIELTSLINFGASKDERTLNSFVPKNVDTQYWDSFIIRMFHDDFADYKAKFESEDMTADGQV